MAHDDGEPGSLALFRSLGTPTRLGVVRRLALGPGDAAGVAAALDRPADEVQSELDCLVDCGLARRSGTGPWEYALAVPELWTLLAAADLVLTATSHAVSGCPRYGTARC